MKKTLFFTTILIIISCNKNDFSDTTIINTHRILNSDLMIIKLQPFRVLDSVPLNLKGIIELDTFSIQYLSFFRKKELEKLTAKKLHIKNHIESFTTGLYAYSGYLNNKQILIVDANNNLDFSDDKKFVFTKNLRNVVTNNRKVRVDSFPLISINYNSIQNKKIIDKKIIIRAYPHLNYRTYKNPSTKIKLDNELRIVAEIANYNYGEFNMENKDYKVAFVKILNQYKFLFRSKNQEFLKVIDTGYKSYKLKDTVNFSNNFYKIDSVNFNESELFLIKLNIRNKKIGHQFGETISDFNLIDIHDNELNLRKLLKGKEYVLLDFWGTWCAPCIELTPQLVRIDSNYSSNLTILSIAFQKDKSKLLEYVNKNKMNWNHVFIKGNAKNQENKPHLINNLRINSYPTFILINKDKKILYRGSGKKALKEIEKIIKK